MKTFRSNTVSSPVAGLIIGVIILAILLVIFGPLVTIFALNALFNLAIPYTFVNWFATLWLSALISGSFKFSATRK